MEQEARRAAALALMRQSDTGAYSNLILEPLMKQAGLDARDSAFAAAIFYGTLERRLTIDHIIAHYSARPINKMSTAVLQILRTGIYQLLYMDGVDDYAAVSESVNLTRTMKQPQASGFVNGVLRGFLRDEKCVPPIKSVNREDQLSIEYSCPAWLIKGWLSDYGEQATQGILTSSLGAPPVYLRTNTARISAAELSARLAAQGVDCEAIAPDGCIRVRGRFAVDRSEEFLGGLFHVQDRASQLCAAAVGAVAGERILDVCAAPGGKTFTIAERMENRGEIVARDLHERRAALVKTGAERLGLSIVKALAGDASEYDPALGQFDRVLCDVPCSGYGAIRRKPEIKYKPLSAVAKLPLIQYKILQISSQYLKSGGTLIYSTCTLLPAENENVVARFLKVNERFSLEKQTTYTGADGDTDGFFVAVLKLNAPDAPR